MVKSKPNNGAKGAPRARRQSRKNVQRKDQTPRRQQQLNTQGIGTVVRTRFPGLGFSDIRGHRIVWIAGYVFVGNGTNGAANAVLCQTADKSQIFGNNTGTLGTCAILAGDGIVGASYVSDIEKHYARKRINKMVLHVVSLQPSTANNMMCVVAPSRGPGLVGRAQYTATATASPISQTFTNVMSMKDAMTVDSWETKSMDITGYIASGSGAKQNEFELQSTIGAPGAVLAGASIYNGAAATVDADLVGLCPAGFTVSGNNTTAGLQNTQTHAIIIEQWCDFIDFVGGQADNVPVGVASEPAPTTEEISRAKALLDRVGCI